MTTKITSCVLPSASRLPGTWPECNPDCNSWECEVACAPEPARPTYPFAPGVIQGPELPIVFVDDDNPWHPFTLSVLLKVLALMLLLGMLSGYLVERFV